MVKIKRIYLKYLTLIIMILYVLILTTNKQNNIKTIKFHHVITYTQMVSSEIHPIIYLSNNINTNNLKLKIWQHILLKYSSNTTNVDAIVAYVQRLENSDVAKSVLKLNKQSNKQLKAKQNYIATEGPDHIEALGRGHWSFWGRPAQVLEEYLKNPTGSCKRMVRLGGTSCGRISDGDKLVCLDTLPSQFHKFDRKISSSYNGCVVLSFGVGGELSFDNAAVHFGCRVHAFDDDPTYKLWTEKQGKGVHFHRARLGTLEGIGKFCDIDKGSCIDYQYYHLQGIKDRLRLNNQTIWYLKLDIEGSEWNILKQALKNGWLSNVNQLAVEIHLEDLRDPPEEINNIEGHLDVMSHYLQVFKALEEEGFTLTATSPNPRSIATITLDNISIPYYAELLWVRSH